jgi:hypothetical protein
MIKMTELNMLHTFLTQDWTEHYPDSIHQQAIKSLEEGQILHFPKLPFLLSSAEQRFLTPDYADPNAKNISYHSQSNKLWGARGLADEQYLQLKSMMDRYSHYAFRLVKEILPRYAQQLQIARTSFRPVQISGRQTSPRKDDKRLHVDAFPSAPNQGKRILRVFCNINPNGEDRVWRVGEPFEKVAAKFLPLCKKPMPGKAAALRLLKITKSYRTPYDHYMLQIHDRMKADDNYQKEAQQQEVHFPPGSTWIVQTDDVSHAAMKGQFVLEQTFYLPVKAMKNESRSPLRVLESLLQQKLV